VYQVGKEIKRNTCWVLLITWCIFHIHNILEYSSTPFFRWLVTIILVKVKQSHYRNRGFREVDVHRIQDNQHMKVVRLSALCNGCLYPPRKHPWCSILSRPQGHNAVRIMSMKNYNNTIGNQTCKTPGL